MAFFSCLLSSIRFLVSSLLFSNYFCFYLITGSSNAVFLVLSYFSLIILVFNI